MLVQRDDCMSQWVIEFVVGVLKRAVVGINARCFRFRAAVPLSINYQMLTFLTTMRAMLFVLLGFPAWAIASG